MLLDVYTIEEGWILHSISIDVGEDKDHRGTHDCFGQVAGAADDDIREMAKAVKGGQ